MIESASNTSRRRRQVWLARMRQRDACWVLEVTLKGSRIVETLPPVPATVCVFHLLLPIVIF